MARPHDQSITIVTRKRQFPRYPKKSDERERERVTENYRETERERERGT